MPTPLFESLRLLILIFLISFIMEFFKKLKKNHIINSKTALFRKEMVRKFTCLRLFHSLRLLILGKFYMPTFIQEPTFIRYSRVCYFILFSLIWFYTYSTLTYLNHNVKMGSKKHFRGGNLKISCIKTFYC